MKCPICHSSAVTDFGQAQKAKGPMVLLMLLEGDMSSWKFDCTKCNIHKGGTFSHFENVASLVVFLSSVPLFIFLFEFLILRGFFPTALIATLFLLLGIIIYFLLYYPIATWFYENRVMQYIRKSTRRK